MNTVKTHDWTPRKRSHVLALIDSGKHSIRQISQLLNISKSTISDIKQCGTSNSKPKSSHSALLSKWDKCRIDAYIKQSCTTRQKTPEIIIKVLNLTISHITFISILHEFGYHYCMAHHCCLLKDIDYKCRLAFV